MSKYEYTDEMVANIRAVLDSGLTEENIQKLVDELGYPRRSVTAKARKLGYEDLPSKPKDAPTFSAEETAALVEFLNSNSGELTAEQIAASFNDGKFTARQINGKALSLELTSAIKPADKKVAPKSFTDEEEATVRSLAESGAFIEDIASAVGKEVAQVRGKLLSMKLSAPQKNKAEGKADAYEGIAEFAKTETVAQLAARYGKTDRGVKTVLTRRGVSATDYTPKAKKESE